MHWSTIFTTGLLAVSRVAAVPTDFELPESNLIEYNVTDSAPELLTAASLWEADEIISKRQNNGGWCVIFYTGTGDTCSGQIYNLWCGTGTTACVPLSSAPDKARSVQWLPRSGGLSLRVATNTNCRACCTMTYGPTTTGCRGVTSNVAQSGLSSFIVF